MKWPRSSTKYRACGRQGAPEVLEIKNNRMGYFVYVLRSDKFQRNYIGLSSDVEKRLTDHNNGRIKSTKPYRPWKLLFYESFETKIEAINREKFLKSGQGRDYIKNYMAS